MNNRIIIYFLMILVLLAFSFGCSKLNVNQPQAINYHQGFSGLEMSFVKNQPPDEVGKYSEFWATLELRNKGPYPIRDGNIILGGFVPDYITITPPKVVFSLDEMSQAYPEGGYERLDFKVKNIGFPEGSDKYPFAFTARAYYDYGTEASADVCINPDVYGYVKTKETGCVVKLISLSGGQGAPIAVTKIEEIISSVSELEVDVDFKVSIANKGKGEVIGNVNVEEAVLSGRKITCEPREITLKGSDEKSILCKTSVERARGAYLAPLTIRLYYTYTQMIDKKLNIISFTDNPAVTK